MTKNPVTELYDAKGNLLGAYVSKELWLKIKDQVLDLVEPKQSDSPKSWDLKEPLEDWELFKKNWDFKYPYDFSVKCDICGNHTDNWEEDKEKKFYLTAASLSGLVSFRCVVCGSKIVKKHFKDKITVECIPMKR